eukprot:4295227-Prymnesium_polylepis.1
MPMLALVAAACLVATLIPLSGPVLSAPLGWLISTPPAAVCVASSNRTSLLHSLLPTRSSTTARGFTHASAPRISRAGPYLHLTSAPLPICRCGLVPVSDRQQRSPRCGLQDAL